MDGFNLEAVVRRALEEDVGPGDATTRAVVPEEAAATARIVAREPGVLAGSAVVREVFRQLDARTLVRAVLPDGARFDRGATLLQLEGPARAILTGERTALNFLQRLCGIATATARMVERAGPRVRVVDTRKTTPGLRLLEKEAVRAGGGHCHRMGLYDAVMIKDNHILAAGGIRQAVARARAAIPHTMTITVECESLAQVDEALEAGADLLLLDNMDPAALAQAVRHVAGRAVTEASGGITEETIAAVAATGVDIVSVGALTHSARALDLSLEIESVRTTA